MNGFTLLDDYLLEFPNDEDGVSIMHVDGKPETVIRQDVLLRWERWLFNHGYINKEIFHDQMG